MRWSPRISASANGRKVALDWFARNRPSPITLVALAALGVMVMAQLASGSHPRPKGATPLRASLVPAYQQCTAPNNTHGPPLAFPSCSPPVQTSNFLTVGTPDANGAGANSVGFAQVKVVGSGNGVDIITTGQITDVRCKPGTNANVCNSANAADGPDYSGELQANSIARATDHFNGPNRDEAATVQDIPNPFPFRCQNTPDTSVGGTCTVPTERPLIPQPYWFAGKRVVIELTHIEVTDGGPDGIPSTQPEQNTLFAVQGVFIP
jgi:hypothetical protein